jgi:transposase
MYKANAGAANASGWSDEDLGHALQTEMRPWKSLLKETGGLTPRQGPVGRPRKLEEHREAILLAIDRKSDLTLEELKSQLNLPGCVKTLWNALQRWGIVLKKSLASRRAEAA